MQLLRILVGQLHRIQLGCSRVHGSLSLTDGSLSRLVVNHKQQLSSTYRLAFLHINLHQETRSFRTYLNILNALDDCGIYGLHISSRSACSQYRILVVTEVRATAATAAA